MNNEIKMSDIYNRMDNQAPFIILYKFTLSLPKEQSVMLSYLIDMDSKARKGNLKRLTDNPDFFECCKDGYINKTLTGWSVHEITAAIKKLSDDGYVYTRVVRDGLKQSTYIKLEPLKIQQLIDEYENQLRENKESCVYTYLNDGI